MAVILQKVCRICFVCVLAVIILLIIFRLRFRDAIILLAETKVSNATSDLINDSIYEQIELGNIQYDRIVYFEKDLDGRITALKTNMAEVNRLKTDILNLINDEILVIDTDALSIPVGSFLIPEIFSGRGPSLPVRVLAIRNSEGKFDSHFSEAGINQTRHQLTMDLMVDVAVLVLGKSEEFTVESHVIIAETVIVGQVPETYFQYGGQYGPER
jgi:sporulation protein YunB